MVRKTIDMSRLDKLKIDGEVANYLVQWDNTLLIAAYDQDRTFILTTEGEKLVLKWRLSEVLDRFAEENSIHSHEMGALYDLVGCRTRGYIAGHHRLVPTCGRSNSQVVCYMVHFLDDAATERKSKKIFMNGHMTAIIA